MSLHVELIKLQRKEYFDTNLDPDPEWWSTRLINHNSKSTTVSALCIKLSITLIRAQISELQMEKFCVCVKENFTLCDIMRSSHNVHLSNHNTKWSTWVALQFGGNNVLV